MFASLDLVAGNLKRFAGSLPVPTPVAAGAIELYHSLQLGAWGDSLTYGYGGEDVSGPYTPYMDQMSKWAPFRPFINEGISGQTSAQIAARFLAAPQYWGWTTIIWSGRNDGPTWGAATVANVQLMVDALEGAGNTRYVVYGITTNGVEYVGGAGEANYNAIVATNALMATAFGDHFFDMRAYMASLQPFTDLSITPNATDLMQIARSEIPTTWRRDDANVHYNNTGTNAQGFVSTQQIAILDASTADKLMTDVAQSYLIGDGTSAYFNDLRFLDKLYMGDPITGSGVVMQGNPRQKIFQVGTGQGIPSTISAATTREWAFFGDNAGGLLSTGRANTGIGTDVMPIITTAGFNTAVGTRALTAAVSASSNVAIGVDALAATVSGTNNVAVGRYCLISSTSTNPSTAVGFQALFSNTSGQGTAIGYQALRANTTGNNCTAVGDGALFANTTGGTNTAIGANALTANTTAGNNTAVGASALAACITGTDNTAVGKSALSLATGSQNTAIGSGALLAATGTNNTAVGYQSGRNLTSGNGNTAIGYQSLFTMTTATQATALGFQALNLATGAGNIAIGYQAGVNLSSGANNIIIGKLIDAPSNTASNQLTIGNLIYGSAVDGSGTTPATGNVGIAGAPSGAGGARLQVFGDTILLNTQKTPASADAGVLGSICWDDSFIYVRTASSGGSWKRAALSAY